MAGITLEQARKVIDAAAVDELSSVPPLVTAHRTVVSGLMGLKVFTLVWLYGATTETIAP